MRPKSLIRLSTVVLFFLCTLTSSGTLLAEQQAGEATPTASAQIDQLTAPIALYPDALLFQIVAASADVEEVQKFGGWLDDNAALKGSELQDAAEQAGFGPAFVALAPFPEVVQMMAQKPEWTKALGAADKNALFDSVQRLRAQAVAAGNLKDTEQQNVETTTTSEGQQVIVIQPANPQVIYVPTYNPEVVYVQQAPPPAGSSAVVAGAIGFTAGVLIAANNSDHYHHYDNYWEDREDYYEERQDDVRENQDERQSDAKANQEERQSDAKANQEERQSDAKASQDERRSNAQGNQDQRQSYQSGSATREQSSRGSRSLSSSNGGRTRGGGGGGGRSGGGGRR